jgi:CheY-like chemotaxis protein
MNKIRVVLADDHVLVREGIRRLIQGEDDMEVVGEAGDGEEACQLVAQTEPDIVLMDIAMPKVNGIEATRQIKESHPLVGVLILTAYDSEEFGCAVKFKVKCTEQHFTQQEELLLYRIVQEALRNIWKHSEATKVDVSIQFSDGRTCVTIKDNGKGFEEMKGLDLVKTGKLGIVGMTERARLLKASWAIHSKRGSGTTIMLNIPRKNGCTFMTSQLQPESQQ